MDHSPVLMIVFVIFVFVIVTCPLLSSPRNVPTISPSSALIQQPSVVFRLRRGDVMAPVVPRLELLSFHSARRRPILGKLIIKKPLTHKKGADPGLVDKKLGHKIIFNRWVWITKILKASCRL